MSRVAQLPAQFNVYLGAHNGPRSPALELSRGKSRNHQQERDSIDLGQNMLLQTAREESINIVKQNWERIQKLRVTIHRKYLGSSSYRPAPRRDYLRSTLYRPAPHLESFSISFDMRVQSTYRDLLPNIFDGNAPMLHEFRLSGPRFMARKCRGGSNFVLWN